MKKILLFNTLNYNLIQKIRIDSFLSEKLFISRSKIEKLFKEKNIICNNEILLKKNYLLIPNKEYLIKVTLIKDDTLHQLSKINIPLNIKFEDDHILIIDKTSNLIVHPTSKDTQNTLLNAIIDKINIKTNANNFLRSGIVHRIDKDTTGLLIVAKTDIAIEKLQKMLKEKQIKRIYTAIVWGMPIPVSGIINLPITRNKNNRMTMNIAKSGEGRMAITHYQTKHVFPKKIASIVECQLETGRTHQIRVHFSAIKNNIIGDKQYGKKFILNKNIFYANQINKFQRQALHATELSFEHPITKENILIKSDLPEDIVNLINFLQNTVKKN